MPFSWGSKGKASAGPSRPSLSDQGQGTSSTSWDAPPAFEDPPSFQRVVSGPRESALHMPMTTRWYLLFDGPFPKFLVPLCELLGLSWSIVKNCTEGSTGSVDAARNKLRERFVILFPDDLDHLPDLSQDQEPPMYTDESAENKRKATTKRNIIDSISLSPLWDGEIMVGENLEHQNSRHGLVEMFNSVFTCRTLKSVVQTRTVRQDKSVEDYSKIRGVEVTLRSLQFDGVTNIEEKLLDLTREGVIWAKYGLWCSKARSPEENLQKGEWIIFGVWPETLKLTKNKDGVTRTWDEPYHVGRGSGRYSVPMGVSMV